MILEREQGDATFKITLEVGDVLDVAVPGPAGGIPSAINLYTHTAVGHSFAIHDSDNGCVRFSVLVDFEETADAKIFTRAVRESPYLVYLSDPGLTPPPKGTRFFLSRDRKTGFAILPDGDLCNVFRNPGGAVGSGKTAVARAIKEGAVTLDAYDGFLTNYYASFGFRVVGRMKWIDEYAHPDWDYARYGKPDVVFMALNADAPVRVFSDWDEAKAYAREVAVANS
jgi:hypothetical protein